MVCRTAFEPLHQSADRHLRRKRDQQMHVGMPKVNVPLRPPESAIRPPLASLPLLRNLQNETPAPAPSTPSTTPPQTIAPPPPTPKALKAKAAPDTCSQKPESDPSVTEP